jgi:pSer/pThr/pTyr-binding forkhead associated (FHA) protein
MPARLVALAGGPDILMDRAQILVGRDRFCDARLVSLRVSRRHCLLTEVAGAVWVRDLGSTNGIWINGRRTVSGWLRPGDLLTIAHIRYRLEEIETVCASRADSSGRLEEGSSSLADLAGTALHEQS